MHYATALRANRFCALALLAVASLSATLAQAAAPKISGSPATSVTVGQAYLFQPSASDADRNTLTFSIANQPGWASFNSQSGKLSGTPYSNHAGTYSGVVISVSDGSSKVSLPSFSIVVKANANKSPTISGTPPGTATAGKAYSFQPVAKDPEGKTLAFSIRNKPAWANFSTSSGLLSGTPLAAGTFSSIIIVATDGVTSTSLTTFKITVSGSGSTSNTAPKIAGSPGTGAKVGTAYSFTPTASDANGDALTFSIQNKPSWAAFSTSTGKLSGTPSATGTFSGVTIAVSDGKASASLAPFAISVASASSGGTTGSASLSWSPPTRNTDGSSLTNLAGYRISYGTSAGALSQTITVSNPGLTNYVVENLKSGTWYFAIKAYTSSGSESAMSNVGSKTIN
jgi:hypothetical protein